MATDDSARLDPGDNTPISEIVGIVPAHITAKVDLDLHAVQLVVADEHGSGCGVLIGAEECLALLVRLCDSLAELLGAGSVQRIHAAQLLVRIAVEGLGQTQRQLAKAIGVTDSEISRWVTARAAPTPEKLRALRRHVKNLLRSTRT